MNNRNHLWGARSVSAIALLSVGLCFGGLRAFAQEGAPDPTPQTEAQAPTTVTIDTPGSVTGGDLGDNPTVAVRSTCSAGVQNPPVSDDTMDVSGPTWKWTGSGNYLDDGLPATDPNHDSSASGSATVAFDSDTSSSTGYTITFDSPGDYVDVLTATATFTETMKTGPDAGTTKSVSFSNIPKDDGTNDGNPGMPDPDSAPPAPSAAVPGAGTSVAPNASAHQAGNGAPPPKKPAPPKKVAHIPGSQKSIYLSSSLGATFYKDQNGKRQQNTLDVNPLNMDTLGSPGNKTITYNGFVHGHWGQNSPYVWTSGVAVGNGLYQPANIQQQPVTYTPATFGSRSSVALRVTDSKGGTAVPDGVGNVTFHKPVNLTKNPDVQSPKPDKPTLASHGDWNILTTHPNPTDDSEQKDELKYTLGAEFEYKASFGGEGTLGVDAKLFDAEFKATIGFDITTTYKQEAEVSWEQKWPAHTETTVFWAYSATVKSGSLDYYDEQGYKGQTPWSVRIPNLGPGNTLTPVHTFATVPL